MPGSGRSFPHVFKLEGTGSRDPISTCTSHPTPVSFQPMLYTNTDAVHLCNETDAPASGCSSIRALHFFLSRTAATPNPSSPILEHSDLQYSVTTPASPTFHGYGRRLATHMAMVHHTRIDRYYSTTTESCRRFIRFARSRSRNKEYLTALKTVEKLLAVTEVALNRFRKTLEFRVTGPSPDLISAKDYISAGRHWEENSDGSCSEPCTPPLEMDTPSMTWGTDADPVSGWEWIANLILYYHETLKSGKCDIITNPKRNSWSRFLEQRYRDWLANDVVWLSQDHRDSYDDAAEYIHFEFGPYVEELLMPGRQYGLLMDMFGNSAV